MEEYETKTYLNLVTDHPFTTDNIYTGTPDTFEDVNPQQEHALYSQRNDQMGMQLADLESAVNKKLIKRKQKQSAKKNDQKGMQSADLESAVYEKYIKELQSAQSGALMTGIKAYEKEKNEKLKEYGKNYRNENKKMLKQKAREKKSLGK